MPFLTLFDNHVSIEEAVRGKYPVLNHINPAFLINGCTLSLNYDQYSIHYSMIKFSVYDCAVDDLKMMWCTAMTVSCWDYVAPSTDGSLVWRLKCHSLSSLGTMCLEPGSVLRQSCVLFPWTSVCSRSMETTRGKAPRAAFRIQVFLRFLTFYGNIVLPDCKEKNNKK